MIAQKLNFTQALFESVSGWTTTGLSVVDVTQCSRLILLWRSIMQLAGGAGLAIIMLAAIVGPVGPALSIAEGRTDQLVPHVRKSAKMVLLIYAGYAAVGILAYHLAGLPLFDSINHSFAAISTGGFSTQPESIGHWDSVLVEAVTLPLMIKTRKFVVMSYISLGLDAEAQEVIEKLIQDFKDHPDLSLALWQASEAYYNEAFRYENEGLVERAEEYFNNVIRMSREFIEESPHSAYAAEAHYILAICYKRLEEYTNAIEYYQKVMDNWPDYKYAWLAQLRVAKIYKGFIKDGVMSESEAESAIKAAYERLLEAFPDCPAADSARTWLNYYLDKSNEGEQK